MKKILVSACLCGVPCRYDAKACRVDTLAELYAEGTAIAVCPECEGGLPTPRQPVELQQGRRATNKEGVDCSRNILEGAQKALEVAKKNRVALAVLKDKSPSCGSTVIYDGSFSGRLISGQGLAAALLADNGLVLANENNFQEYLKRFLG